ncbi:ADP-ribosylglycohydrolase [Ascobolus immersus RN42]|uniref:ADP-ribosylhydrolase ARH3 n=1 Tax=Ascobolus immersus RN42 TaxID=1160509 RepID=A0A3N4IM60_ASCIM|nr:ADP-ribosylglycohydrolase [Ascobolus immersus RN42]
MKPEDLSTSLLPLAPIPTKLSTALFGLAICDALGGPVEFKRRGSFPTVSKMLPNTTFKVPAGSWTDDTSLALCLAWSLISNAGKIDLLDHAKRYYQWRERGYMSCTGHCFDCGNTIRYALTLWETTEFTSEEKGVESVRKTLDKSSFSGNGSLMRVLPVALAGWRDLEVVVKNAGRSTEATHPNVMCREACQVYCLLVATILQNVEKKNESFSKKDLFEVLEGFEFQSKELGEAVGKGSGLLGMKYEEIRSSGYVLHSLQAALWAFFTSGSFEEGAVLTVNMGDDADTVGAIYGGLAGCWYGDALYDDIDGSSESGFWTKKVKEWRGDLQKPEMIEKVVGGLVELNGGGTGGSVA